MRTLTTVASLFLLCHNVLAQPPLPNADEHKDFVNNVLFIRATAAQVGFKQVFGHAARLQNWPDDQINTRLSAWFDAVNSVTVLCQVWSGLQCKAGETTPPLRLDDAPFVPLAFINRYDQLVADGCPPGQMRGAEIRFEYVFRSEVYAIFEIVLGCQTIGQIKADMKRWRGSAVTPSTFLDALLPADVEDLRLRLLVDPSGGSLWRLSEFHFVPAGLHRTLLARELDVRATSGWPDRFAQWVNETESEILSDRYSVGAELQLPVAKDSLVGGPNDRVLALPAGREDLRTIISRNRCRGCHGGETATKFSHVDAATKRLSPFLTGDDRSGEPSLDLWQVTPVLDNSLERAGTYRYNDFLRRHLWWRAFLAPDSPPIPANLLRFDHAVTPERLWRVR